MRRRDAMALRPSGRWAAPWLALSCVGGAGITVLDALLLQLRRSYFTGGFLAVDHVSSVGQALGFFSVSFIADLALVGVGVVVGLWIASRLGLQRWGSMLLALAVATAPILIADLIAYELVTYLGDAFDLRLMFDLTGRQLSEVLAVASAHLWKIAVASAALVTAVTVVVWLLRRRLRARPSAVAAFAVSGRAVLALMFVLVAAGAVVTTWARTESDVLDNGLRRKPTVQALGAVVMTVTDVDRDGFGLLGRPPDPDLFDARVRPYALDVPGNGIDENGVGGDLPADLPPYVEPPVSTAAWPAKPPVVLIVLESFRADAVRRRLNGVPVTPVLDALAARGLRIDRAFSHNGYTVQSRRHIFSGSVADLARGTSIVDDFNAQGYQTAYFSAQDESFGGPAQGVGFERAQVHYDARNDRDRRYSNFSTAGSLAVPYDVLNERIDQFLSSQRTTQPLFLYVNYHDTHFPYRHKTIASLVSTADVAQGDIAPGRAAALQEMYFNTAANVDRAIGVMLERVRRALGVEPAILVLADHGESLYDEGFLGHGYALNDVQTHIPLIAVNLPITLPEPFGQADLRRAISDAMAAPAGAPRRAPPDPGRVIFQYLGNVDRPAQIAFTSAAGRLIYDLRARQASTDGTTWQHDDDLEPALRVEVLHLIHTWERMLHARAAARQD